MEIILSSTSGRPIYEQITLQIKEMIMKGDLPVVFGFFAVLILVLHLNFYALYFASTFQIRFFDIRSEKALLTKRLRQTGR